MLIFQSVKNHDDHQLNIAENSMISANTKSSSVKYHHDENTLISDQKIRAIVALKIERPRDLQIPTSRCNDVKSNHDLFS